MEEVGTAFHYVGAVLLDEAEHWGAARSTVEPNNDWVVNWIISWFSELIVEWLW